MGLPQSNQTADSYTSSMWKASSTNTMLNSFVEVPVKALNINVFFDGTGNNLYNTDAYKTNRWARIKADTAGVNNFYGSYTNEYSNVAHLYSNRNLNDDVWVYIDGIGTTRNQSDSVIGMASGTDITGIVARVRQSFGKMYDEYKNKFGVKKPTLVNINVFGFSRGAAAARYFVHLAKTEPHRFRGLSLKSSQIRFKFVGLFDTVSSYGFDFEDDVEDLHLDFRNLDSDDKKITKVVHIVAKDEFRKNFSLTDITQARRGKYGCEIILNGAHSDIGGGYADQANEEYVFTNDNLKNWLVNAGLFNSNDIKKYNINSSSTSFYKAIRSKISNNYHKIPLKIMRMASSRVGGLSYKSKIVNHENMLNGILKNLSTQFSNSTQTLINNNGWGQKLDLTLRDINQLKNLRRNYIHWSVSNSTGMDVRLNNSQPYRAIHTG